MYMFRSLSHGTKKVRYAYIYFVLSATYQAKAVRELTQHVRGTTSKVSEQNVSETSSGRNDRTRNA